MFAKKKKALQRTGRGVHEPAPPFDKKYSWHRFLTVAAVAAAQPGWWNECQGLKCRHLVWYSRVFVGVACAFRFARYPTLCYIPYTVLCDRVRECVCVLHTAVAPWHVPPAHTPDAVLSRLADTQGCVQPVLPVRLTAAAAT